MASFGKIGCDVRSEASLLGADMRLRAEDHRTLRQPQSLDPGQAVTQMIVLYAPRMGYFGI
jgi:hypothetical protein